MPSIYISMFNVYNVYVWKVVYSVSSKQNERWATQARPTEPLVFFWNSPSKFQNLFFSLPITYMQIRYWLYFLDTTHGRHRLTIPLMDICMIYWQHLTPKSTCLQSPYLLLVNNNSIFHISICKKSYDDPLGYFCMGFFFHLSNGHFQLFRTNVIVEACICMEGCR
jgi:hypothetical protein